MYETTRANRTVAGKSCPTCNRSINLGDEVTHCPRCGMAMHIECRQSDGTCKTCCKEASAPAATGGAMAIRLCPACAESIPSDATTCPLCSENLLGPIGVPQALREFTAGGRFSRNRWKITFEGDELLAREGSGVLIRATRDQVKLKRLFFKIKNESCSKKFFMPEIGYHAIYHWQTGTFEPKVSVKAKDALLAAIIGPLLCLPLLASYAIIKGGRARKEIKQCPELITGDGVAVAAQIIGVIEIILLVLVAVVHISNI